MKRFIWRLQPLLDLTIQREKLLRAEVYALAQDIILHRSQIAQQRAELRMKLIDLAEQDLSDRLAGQANFVKYTEAIEKKIRSLTEQLEDLKIQQKEKTEQLAQAKSSREALEEKRTEAKVQHTKAMLKHEQKQLDEVAHLAIARQIIDATVAEHTLTRRQTG